MTSGGGGLESSVYPSGSARYAASAPMLPAAPGRLSTITGWPHFSASFSATMRGIRSALPPAGNGTMMRTGFAGHSCAWTMKAAPSSAANRSARIPPSLKRAQANHIPDVLALDAVLERLRVETRHHGTGPPGVVDEALRGAAAQARAQRGEAAGLVARLERDLGFDEEGKVFDGLRAHGAAFIARLAHERECPGLVAEVKQHAREVVAHHRRRKARARLLGEAHRGARQLAGTSDAALRELVPGGMVVIHRAVHRPAHGERGLHAVEIAARERGVAGAQAAEDALRAKQALTDVHAGGAAGLEAVLDARQAFS